MQKVNGLIHTKTDMTQMLHTFTTGMLLFQMTMPPKRQCDVCKKCYLDCIINLLYIDNTIENPTYIPIMLTKEEITSVFCGISTYCIDKGLIYHETDNISWQMCLSHNFKQEGFDIPWLGRQEIIGSEKGV